MAKTELTKELEKSIYGATIKMGVFGCFEVTIGFQGNERVDYMTMDTKNIFRCYEIKISKSDFHSKCKNTFVGHYNYYVMPKELYEEVKEEIPKEIGVYVIKGFYAYVIKNPRKQNLKVDEQVLKDSMIRSLSREFDKFLNTNDVEYINKLKNRIGSLKSKNRDLEDRYIEKSNELFMLQHGKESAFNE